MSERIEIAGALLDALNHRDWERLRAIVAPGFVYDLSRTDSPMRGVYRGLDEVLLLIEEFYGPWESVRYEAHELIEAGESVVMRYTSHFRGREGIEVTAHATWLFGFRGRTLVSLTLYPERADALEAAR